MACSIESLGIDRLSVSDRLELIEQIWNSLPEQVDQAEVPRSQVDVQPGLGKPWREALDAIEGKK